MGHLPAETTETNNWFPWGFASGVCSQENGCPSTAITASARTIGSLWYKPYDAANNQILFVLKNTADGNVQWFQTSIQAWRDLTTDSAWVLVSNAVSNECAGNYISLMSTDADRFLRCSTSTNTYLTDANDAKIFLFHYREVTDVSVTVDTNWKKQIGYEYNVFVRNSAAAA